jgi:NTE family protein
MRCSMMAGCRSTGSAALNAAVLASAYARGGAAGARSGLRQFWMDVARSGACFGSLPPMGMGADLGRFNLDLNPFFNWGMQWLKALGPYQFNPLGLDPLRQVLARHVDVAALRDSPLRVFVAATDVQTGQPEIFSGQRLGIDALLASACLPQLFQAVVIEGRPYWDGGYSGNPALWPLIYQTRSSDLLLVKINPLVRPGVPDRPEEIADRVNEVTFNAGLVAEMRAIHFVQRLLAEQRLQAGRYKDLRLHMVADEENLGRLRASSKMNTDRNFLLALFELGRGAAQRWLAAHAADVGRRSTVDIEASFLAPRQGRGAGEAA